MYKDKDKQREANRKAQAKFKAKGITKGITIEGITDRVLPKNVPAHGLTAGFEKTEFPKTVKFPTHKRGKDIMRPLTDKDVAAMPLVTVVNKPCKPQSHNPMMVGYVPPKN